MTCVFGTEFATIFAEHITEFGQTLTYTPVSGSAYSISALVHEGKTNQYLITPEQEQIKGLIKFTCAQTTFSGKTITLEQDTVTFNSEIYAVDDYSKTDQATIKFTASRIDVEARRGRGRRVG